MLYPAYKKLYKFALDIMADCACIAQWFLLALFMKSTNVPQLLCLFLGIYPGDLKHDSRRSVDIDERPVQLLLQCQIPFSSCNVYVLQEHSNP